MLTINDASTGAACDKPAFWLDANMHAGEVTGCEAALHFVGTLLGRWDAEDEWTRAVLAEAACLVVPRISPDSAEFMLTTPYSCRSSPVQLDPLDFPGFVADDVDGKAPAVVVSGRAIGRGMTRPSPGSTSNVRPAESSSISFKPV